MGGTTSIDVTREGVDKAYGLERLSCESGIPLDAMLFVGDAIFPGGNDYPAQLLGLDTICVRDPREALSVIAAIVACLADRHASPEGITPPDHCCWRPRCGREPGHEPCREQGGQ